MTERARVSAYPRICVINSLWEVYFLAVWLERSFRRTKLWQISIVCFARACRAFCRYFLRWWLAGWSRVTRIQLWEDSWEWNEKERRVELKFLIFYCLVSEIFLSLFFNWSHERRKRATFLNCICQIVQKSFSFWKNGKRPSVSKYRIACVFSSRSDFLAVYLLPTHNRIHSCRRCGNLSENSSGS